jgi:hypothetical protein
MIGTLTLIIMVIVMYTAGALVSDTILRDTELTTVKGVIAELLLFDTCIIKLRYFSNFFNLNAYEFSTPSKDIL